MDRQEVSGTGRELFVASITHRIVGVQGFVRDARSAGHTQLRVFGDILHFWTPFRRHYEVWTANGCRYEDVRRKMGERRGWSGSAVRRRERHEL